jgi:hypothetical protein
MYRAAIALARFVWTIEHGKYPGSEAVLKALNKAGFNMGQIDGYSDTILSVRAGDRLNQLDRELADLQAAIKLIQPFESTRQISSHMKALKAILTDIGRERNDIMTSFPEHNPEDPDHA